MIFGSEKEYLPYRFNEFATAYYRGGGDRDYIVMSKPGENTAQTATHEYVHLIAKHAGLKYPPWLNEGMADLYSSLKPQGNKVLIGTPLGGRLQEMITEKWVPLSVILATGHDSPYYNEKNKAGIFYSESWALVHMLALSKEYNAKFDNAVLAIQAGTPSVDALEKTYGKPLAKIDYDLQGYVRGSSFNGALVDVKLETSKDPLLATPASSFDVELALTDLVNEPGHEAEAKKRWEALTKQDPKRPEPWTNLGYLAWRSGHNPEAAEDFGKAFDLGARGENLLWDYGRVAERSHPDDSLRALAALTEEYPNRLDARIEMATVNLSLKRPAQAIAGLQSATNLSASDPLLPRFFYVKASAQIQMGDRDGARASIENLAKYAKTPQDRDSVDRLNRFLAAPVLRAAAGAAIAAPELILPDKPDAEPAVAPIPQSVKPAAVKVPPLSMEGSFVEFVCQEKALKIVVQTSRGKKTFLIKDPNNIVVAGRGTGKVELNCGAQKPVPVRIEYSPPTETGVDGLLKGIYFQ